MEEAKSKIRAPLEKEIKKCFEFQRELARGSNWAKEFPEPEVPDELVGS